jgi:nitric oxide reductase activation protein
MIALWHAVLVALAGRLRHAPAAVTIRELRRGLEVHYHGLGGELSDGVVGDGRFAWLDRGQARLPARIDRYPDMALNRELYFWLAAFLACDRPLAEDPLLPLGVRHLLRGVATSARLEREFPGLAPRYRRLRAAEPAQRASALPGWDARSGPPALQLEAAIRHALGGAQPPRDAWLLSALDAARREAPLPRPLPRRGALLPFLPVPLWANETVLKRGLFRRRLPRRVKRMGSAVPAQGESAYPEWDDRQRTYRPDWCLVGEEVPAAASAPFDAALARHAGQVRKQFEMLRQYPAWSPRRESGEELDVDACVEAAADARGCGRRSARLYRQRARRRRELSVAVLADVSRSTAAQVGERRVIDIARDALLMLAEAFAAAGDDLGLYAFASDSRLRVRCYRIKGFDEAYGDASRERMLGLQPRYYTRVGAAVRHVAARLAPRPAAHKLLLVLTDGRPNDPADGYEGRYGREDTRRALLEARARGLQCFGLAIAERGGAGLAQLFGPGHYAVLADPRSLPRLCGRITAGAY